MSRENLLLPRIVPQNVLHTFGSVAQHTAMIAVMSVTKIIASALGPKSRTKLIQLEDGDVLVTNDGATILKHLHILHPAAERLVRAARQQELIVGDGTTSVVIFSGTLAARTLRLIASNSTMSQNIIPSLTSAFQRATCSALEFLHRIAVPFENSSAPTVYRQFAQCALRTKSITHCRDLLSELVVQAVLNIASQPVHNIEMDLHLARVLGKQLETSYWLDGIVFDGVVSFPHLTIHNLPTVGPYHIIILLLRTPNSTSPRHNKSIMSEEEEIWTLHSERLRTLSVNILISDRLLSDVAVRCLCRSHIVCIHSVEVRLLYALAKCTGALPLFDLSELELKHVGGCEQFKIELSDEDERQTTALITVGRPRYPHRISTIVLHATTHDLWQSLATDVNDAVRVVYTSMMTTHSIVGGGGSTEVALALYLTQLADSLTGPTKEAYLMYAESLETIPYLLAQNAGVDPIQTLASLRSVHRQRHDVWMGLDSSSCRLVDVQAAGIIEPFAVKEHMLRIGIDAVCDLVTIHGFFIDTPLLEKVHRP